MYKNVQFWNQNNENIPRCDIIDQKMKNIYELWYHCSKDCSNILFGCLRIRDKKDEPFFPEKGESLSYEIIMKTMCKKDNGTKRRKIWKYIRLWPLQMEFFKLIITYLWRLFPKTHVKRDFLTIYGYYFLINHSQML